ncbi:hypothetical protein MmiAt1_17240 [Methanimicrococcus sp. At1]|uniref:Uncharacterized protein n=1 Tax=Methanimicrococcus hacksteinii TaxID=3028293 RepID=A0ABU3VT66_9EURY|nr:hypothetical protein [Methanimicrococcus sp. At1]
MWFMLVLTGYVCGSGGNQMQLGDLHYSTENERFVKNRGLFVNLLTVVCVNV